VWIFGERGILFSASSKYSPLAKKLTLLTPSLATHSATAALHPGEMPTSSAFIMIAMAQLRHRPEQCARISDNFRRPEVETKKPANAGFHCFTTGLFKKHHTPSTRRFHHWRALLREALNPNPKGDRVKLSPH
jgi:hypothetical protein